MFWKFGGFECFEVAVRLTEWWVDQKDFAVPILQIDPKYFFIKFLYVL